ncbi:hypothetical protein RRG08_014860 [Elysia crispata]|uniref:Uncharacterized protein n=1 Tax=Elysia crispata TaxID=231223 RepID=A0AAE1ANE9_9GAST|nr:hypothetical protein RRG08_014860 [Elysia crispata]
MMPTSVYISSSPALIFLPALHELDTTLDIGLSTGQGGQGSDGPRGYWTQIYSSCCSCPCATVAIVIGNSPSGIRLDWCKRVRPETVLERDLEVGAYGRHVQRQAKGDAYRASGDGVLERDMEVGAYERHVQRQAKVSVRVMHTELAETPTQAPTPELTLAGLESSWEAAAITV